VDIGRLKAGLSLEWMMDDGKRRSNKGVRLVGKKLAGSLSISSGSKRQQPNFDNIGPGYRHFSR
jgi:hypothetical protein